MRLLKLLDRAHKKTKTRTSAETKNTTSTMNEETNNKDDKEATDASPTTAEQAPPPVTDDDDALADDHDITRHSRGDGLLPAHNPASVTSGSTKELTFMDPESSVIIDQYAQEEFVLADLEAAIPEPPSSRIGRIYRKTSKEICLHSAHDPLQDNNDEEPDVDPDRNRDDSDDDATWRDVGIACCCHTPSEWLAVFIGVMSLLFFLYFFLLGLELLGTSFKVVGGCTAGSLLGSDTNPLASVMIGILATALLQSSSTTTAIIVSLVSGGLDVEQGIYMVMGANVGTSVTSMIVSLAHMGDGDELERAFAGASVLWVFNFLTLLILLPIEVTTEYLYRFTLLMLPASVGEGESWEGPIKKIVSPLGNKIIIANNDLIDDISTGEVESCSFYYPVECEGGVESFKTCPLAGLIGCDEKTNKCPAFFQDGATKQDDMVSGWVCLAVSLFLLIFCLVGMVTLLRKMLLGASTRIIYKATSINDYVGMMVGCGMTILVQSSSITTSVLVPLAGMGILKLESMFPIVLGSDIGTTFTALMAAMVSSEVQALQIALAHLFFNVTGILIWYPIPFMRRIPLRCARQMGKATRSWRNFPILFIVLMYFLLPLILLGISTCFEKDTKGFTALGVFLVLLIGGGVLYFAFWWRFRNGKMKCLSGAKRRQRRAAAIKLLADDMDYLKCDIEYVKNEIGRMKDYAGLPRSMEEGRPPRRPSTVEDHGQAEMEEDDRVSLYESCQSKPWQRILVLASKDVQSSLHSLMGSANKF